MRRFLLAATALTFSATPALAATDWHAEGKAMLGDVIAIPSVSTRPAITSS